ASRPTACMPVDRSAWSNSRPTRTSCAAAAPSVPDGRLLIHTRHPLPGLPTDTRRRIGLLGGSFNPAHEGHLHVSQQALKRLGPDFVWCLVPPQNPLKPVAGMAPLHDRVRDAKKIVRHPRILVLDIEHDFHTHYS